MASKGTPATHALGRAIRERREEDLDLTQEEAAHRASVTVRHYQRVERGTTDAGITVLLAIAKALRTTLQALLDRADEIRKHKPRAAPTRPPAAAASRRRS